jgi:branched-chain amino acid transport system ATP-binding protein
MTAPLLSVRNLSKRFGGLTAVDSVSFDIARGELVSIVGPNGAGKTTLFNLLTGQLRPSSGEIAFEGRDIGPLQSHQRARLGLGRTFQISQTLTSLTTLENAMIGAFLHRPGLSDAARHAQAILDLVGLGARAHVLSRILTLSERRRLEMARALALDPKIVLLDEVMAGLNPTETEEIVTLVKSLHGQGFTFIVIEHNLKVVRQVAERVIVLDRGAKLAEGGADAVLTNPAVVEAYIGKARRP